MSISSTKIIAGFVAAALAVASSGASAGDKRVDPRYDSRYDNRYDNRYDDRDGGDGYDYARVVNVEPLMTRVRVSTPQRECWNETRYDEGRYGPMPRGTAGGTVVGAVIGAVIGHQIGHGQGRRAATAAGAVIGGAIGNNAAQRRQGAYGSVPPREYSVERCEVRYHDEWEERVDSYRVTYVYHGREQVTELPYKPGDRIRVRVDVTPAE